MTANDLKNNTIIPAIIGQTASGKTQLAVALAAGINGEIISADSRQVYCGMDIGTGKDLHEYTVNGIPVPYHLIDICQAGEQYDVFRYQQDFLSAYRDIIARNKRPVLCGGSGMYIDAVVSGYAFRKVPVDEHLRQQWKNLSDDELITQLKQLKPLHNTTDITDRKRLERALEIALFEHKHPAPEFPKLSFRLFAPVFPREELKKRITERLKQRLQNGMIDEVQRLLTNGLSVEQLKYYGLEYKFIALYLNNELNYNDMFQKLNSAIWQFSKRQLTYFKRMEKKGHAITWINGNLPLSDKLNIILESL